MKYHNEQTRRVSYIPDFGRVLFDENPMLLSPGMDHDVMSTRSLSSIVAQSPKQSFGPERRSSLLLDPPPSALLPSVPRARTGSAARTWTTSNRDANLDVTNPFSKRSRGSLEVTRDHDVTRILRSEGKGPVPLQLRPSTRRMFAPARPDSPVSLEDPASYVVESTSPLIPRRVLEELSSAGGSGSGGPRSAETEHASSRAGSSSGTNFNKDFYCQSSSSTGSRVRNLAHSSSSVHEVADWTNDFVRVPPKRREWWAYLGRPKTAPQPGVAHVSSQTIVGHPNSRKSTTVAKGEAPRFGEWRGSKSSKKGAPSTRLRRSLARAGPSKSRNNGPQDGCSTLNSSGGAGLLEGGNFSGPNRTASFTYESVDLVREDSTGSTSARLDLTPTRYGRHWALDLFALYHNVVREQLGQMTCILRRISVAPSGPQPFLVDLFFWLDHFQRVVNAILAAHERAIFPWIETVAQLERRVSKAAREEAQTQMEEASIAISRCREVLTCHGDDQFAFASLSDCLTVLGSQLLEYFRLIEKECPSAVEMFLTESAKEDVEVSAREVIMKNKGQAEVFFPLVAIWLEKRSHSLYQQWLNRVIPLSRRIQLKLWIRTAKSGFLKVGDRMITSPQYL